MKHLTEEQIQEYLDGSGDSDMKSLAAHLYLCPGCRKLYEEYQKLYLGLAKTEIPELSPGFPQKVMTKITSVRPEPEKPSVWIPIFAVANIAVGLAAILYFVDFSFLGSFATIFDRDEGYIQVVVAKLSGYLNIVGLDLNIILIAGAAIVIIAIIDYVLRTAKKRPATFVV